MAKEFDIYLNDRLTQCDIIVYSIPYRDGLTVMNRIILETCLESYMLQKFIAVQSNSVLVSHIDEMIKTCVERLNHEIALGTSAQFQVHYSVRPTDMAIELGNECKIAANIFTQAENILRLTSSPVSAYVKRPFGWSNIGMEIDSSVEETFKRDLEKAAAQLELCADSLDTKKCISEKFEAPVIVGTKLDDLLYRLYDMGSMAIEIAAQALETEIHFSLGRCKFPIVLDSSLVEALTTVFSAAENAVNILSRVAASLIQFMNPVPSAVDIVSDVEAITKRHRLLGEMDYDAFSVYDDMSLEDIDYVIL